MLVLSVGGTEVFDGNKFQTIDAVELRLEHSLVSLSKWESKNEKPFLNEEEKSLEDVRDYVIAMVLNEDFDPATLELLEQHHFDQIREYVQSKQSATWFNEPKGPSRRSQTITSELIYSWMVAMQIPFECQYWHLNRLLTLIRVVSANNDPKGQKKMSRRDAAAQQRSLNAQRRAALNSSG